MGFLNKKRSGPSGSSASALSENDIQKKLYGEFNTGNTQIVTGEREVFRAPAPLPSVSREPAADDKGEGDLFSSPKETALRPAPFEPKPADRVARHVPIHDFEQRPASSVPQTSTADPNSRFQYNRPEKSRLASLQDAVRVSSEKTSALFSFLRDPKQVFLRRFFYWSLAGLAVFLLFWGVNALNSQRELAMRARYKITPEAIPAPAQVSVPVPETLLPKPPVEREVVITPAPVKVSKTVSAPVIIAQTPYVIQVVTYPSRLDAEQVVSSMKKEGLRAFVKESARPNGGMYYLVLIGGFRTSAEAQAQLLKFRAKEIARPFQDAFVKTSRS